MEIERRFCLIDRDGVLRYPYKKRELATGRYGFALGNDKGGKGEYIDSFEEMVRAVVLDGKSIRVKSLDGDASKRGNIVSLHAMREISGYTIDPAFYYLVKDAPIQPEVSDFERIDRLTEQDYISACQAVLDKATQNQLAMLIGHASAPGHTSDMESIASFGGYTNYESANIQYGRLGRFFADFFGIGDLSQQMQALATTGEKNSDGRWQWVMRPALLAALVDLGVVEEAASGPIAKAVAQEIDQDPRSVGVSETTRQALINARIGQGGYRKRMLKLWDGRCAVTGCSVETALVASHAKAWIDSSNDERLDEYNGLLLVASVDKLFDAGLISFTDEGQMLFSSAINEAEMASLGIGANRALRLVDKRHRPYLQSHRRQFGF